MNLIIEIECFSISHYSWSVFVEIINHLTKSMVVEG
jgi:hypothetical protein